MEGIAGTDLQWGIIVLGEHKEEGRVIPRDFILQLMGGSRWQMPKQAVTEQVVECRRVNLVTRPIASQGVNNGLNGDLSSVEILGNARATRWKEQTGQQQCSCVV